jgi:hypothetical protein
MQLCTYFDGRYAPRALLMLRSLVEVFPRAEVTALALDEGAMALAPHAPSSTRFVTLADLLAADASLATARASGPERGFLMTVKPAWLTWVLRGLPPGSTLTYVDADMTFLAPLDEAIAEADAASVVLSPQRFAVGPGPERIWGRYNAGWLGLRHDATALGFLSDWRRDCIGRMSPGYSNQRFLDRAEALYPGVRVLAHRGVNVGPWNVAGLHLSERDGSVVVDGRPLVAYHMAGLFPLPFGRCATGVTGRVLRGPLEQRVYLPYLDRLRSAARELGIAPAQALGRVEWPKGFRERWRRRLVLLRGWARGGALAFEA